MSEVAIGRTHFNSRPVASIWLQDLRMKSAIVFATVVTSTAAFTAPPSVRRSSTRLAAIDPFASATDLPQHVDALSQFFSSLTVADLDVDAAASAASDVAAAAAPAADVADAAAQQGNGWFGFLAAPIEGLLKVIHIALTSMGMSADAWGISIIAMTVVIKLLTFPLTKSQLESTNKMQVSSTRNNDSYAQSGIPELTWHLSRWTGTATHYQGTPGQVSVEP